MKALFLAMLLAAAAARELIENSKNLKCSQLPQAAGGATAHGVSEIPLTGDGDQCNTVYLYGTLYPFHYCYNVNAGMLYNWSSPDLAIDDIILKGSETVILYYPPDGAYSDDDPVHTTPNKQGIPSAISHIDVCWFYRLVLASEPVVSTQHNVSYQWTIAVTPAPVECVKVDQEQKFTISTTFTLSYVIFHEDWSLEGSITVTNPDPDISPTYSHPANIKSWIITYNGQDLVTDCEAVTIAGGESYTCKFWKTWETPNAPPDALASGVSIQIVMDPNSPVKSSPIFIPVAVPFTIASLFHQCIIVTPTLTADGATSFDFVDADSDLPANHEYCVEEPSNGIPSVSGVFSLQALVFALKYDSCGKYNVFLVVSAPGAIGDPADTAWCIDVKCPPEPPISSEGSGGGGGEDSHYCPPCTCESTESTDDNAESSEVPKPPVDKRCTRTQGYWKNPKKNWCVNGGDCPLYRGKPWWNSDDDFHNSLLNWQGMLQQAVGQPMPSQPAEGKCVGYCALAHQYIAARLNIQAFGTKLDGLDEVLGWLHDAEVIFDNADVRLPTWPNVQDMKDLNDKLDSFNNGHEGIRHCD